MASWTYRATSAINFKGLPDTMPQLAYVNGRIVPKVDATISIEDRGFQFADGVYEVVAIFNGKRLDWPQHLTRLHRSLDELAIRPPMGDTALSIIIARLLRLNRIRDGLLYIQITRGAAPRDHAFPNRTEPTLVMTAKHFDFGVRTMQQQVGVNIITHPEQRWARRDIKSVSLLPNVLAKQAAASAGAFEAWFVDGESQVTEGSSTNAWIVEKHGTIVTHPLGNDILAGVMRGTLIRLAQQHDIKIAERAFSLDDALAAGEVFLTSTTAPCLPVISIDGTRIANGKPGAVTQQLAALLWDEINRQTGYRPPQP